MDAQKADIAGTFPYAEAEDMDLIVSDGTLGEKTVREFEKAGIHVL
jgi:hypothetical protein